MKNATPSDKRKSLALEKIDSLETEAIAEKYRKTGGIDGHQFDFLIDKYEWTSFTYRKDFIDEIISKNFKLEKSFINFRKALIKNYPEYKYLIEREDWKFPLQEIFLFGGIQYDTEVPFGNISWSVNNQENALCLKILPGANKKEIIDFLNESKNNLDEKFKQIGIVSPKVKARTKRDENYDLDLWVRVLNNFSSKEIRETFSSKFPNQYQEKFILNGKHKSFARIKYTLISYYLFHRFNLSTSGGRPYSAETIKAIIQKSNKNKTQIKKGLISKIP